MDIGTINKALDEIKDATNNMKCCGNCMKHDYDPRGFCNIKKTLTHGCNYCAEWEFDDMASNERKDFELPSE